MKKNLNIMNMTITIILWLIIFIVKWQYDMGNIDVDLKCATVIGVMVNIFCIASTVLIEKKITSPYVIFQIMSIPFLYGQLICRELLNVKIDNMFDLKILVTEESLINACFLIAYCQLALHLGNSIYKIVRHKSNKKIMNIDKLTEQVSLKKVGTILLVISIIPATYNFVMNFKTTSTLGYDGLAVNRTYGLASILDKIVPFFQISLYMLMIANKENKFYSKSILCFIITFYGIQMFFGNRGKPIIAVITAIWLYHIAVKKIDKKMIIIILIMIIPLSTVINIIRETRDEMGFGEWINNIGGLIIASATKNNPIVETCYEMGTAIYPTAYTIKTIPGKQTYRYGKTYLLSCFSIISINTSGGKNNLAYNMNIAAQMSEDAGSPFGGSYIQEAYANFGWLSPIFIIFLGMLFEMINRKTLNSKNLIEIVLIAYLLNSLLWSVRNVLVTLPREICWYIIPTYLIYKLVYNQQKNKE